MTLPPATSLWDHDRRPSTAGPSSSAALMSPHSSQMSHHLSLNSSPETRPISLLLFKLVGSPQSFCRNRLKLPSFRFFFFRKYFNFSVQFSASTDQSKSRFPARQVKESSLSSTAHSAVSLSRHPAPTPPTHLTPAAAGTLPLYTVPATIPCSRQGPSLKQI